MAGEGTGEGIGEGTGEGEMRVSNKCFALARREGMKEESERSSRSR